MNDVRQSSGTRPILQCSMLLWLDENFYASQDQQQTDLQLLQELINDVHVFDNIEACIDIMTDVEEQKLFLIMSNACAQNMIRHIHNIAGLHRVYITADQSSQQTGWIDDWPKIRGIYDNVQSI